MQRQVLQFDSGQDAYYHETRARIAILRGMAANVDLILRAAPVPHEDRPWFVFMLYQHKTLGLIHPRSSALRQDLVERSHEYAARMCAIRFRLPGPCFVHTVPIMAGYAAWMRGLNGAIDRTNARRGGPHDWHMTKITREILTQGSFAYDFDTISRRVLAVARSFDAVPPRTSDPDLYAASLYSLARSHLSGWDPALMVDASGTVQLGARQARDGLNKVFGERPDRPLAGSGDGIEFACDDLASLASHDGNEVFEAIDARMFAEDLGRKLDAERRRSRPGSVAHQVAEYVLPFLREELSLPEVAKRINRSESAVWKALESYRLALRKVSGGES